MDHVGQFCDEGAILKIAGQRISPFVVNEEEVTERPVDDVEPDVRAPLPRVGVVLDSAFRNIDVENE